MAGADAVKLQTYTAGQLQLNQIKEILKLAIHHGKNIKIFTIHKKASTP